MSFWQQVEDWEICLFVICVLAISVYAWKTVDFENIMKKDSPVPVHMGGSFKPNHKLQNITHENIPDYVYQSLDKDKQFKRYLVGNHKYIFLFTYPGCPYSRHYSQSFKHAFNTLGFGEYYRKRIQITSAKRRISCPAGFTQGCATVWFFQKCFGNLCLFNPQRKQVIIDYSHNAQQLPDLLETYKEW